MVKNPSANARDVRNTGSIPATGDGMEEGMQPTLGFVLGESHGQRSLAGYSPWS